MAIAIGRPEVSLNMASLRKILRLIGNMIAELWD